MPFAGEPNDLWNPQVEAKAADGRPVSGPMAPHVGQRYSAEELWGYYTNYRDVYPNEEAQLRPLAARIRAFDVPRLTGVTFSATRLRDVAPALHALLLERLPGIPWGSVDTRFPGLLVARLKKGAIIHEILEAPVDEATDEPTVLELYGHLTGIDGQQVGRGWFQDLRPAGGEANDDTPIGQMTFRLERATYANTRSPGVGVPFYM